MKSTFYYVSETNTFLVLAEIENNNCALNVLRHAITSIHHSSLQFHLTMTHA